MVVGYYKILQWSFVAAEAGRVDVVPMLEIYMKINSILNSFFLS